MWRRLVLLTLVATIISVTKAMSTSATCPPPRVAVIVGAGSKHAKDGDAADFPPTSRFGLGGSLAIKFGAAYDHVVLLGRRKAVLDAVAKEVTAAGGKVSTHECDVSSDESVKKAFEAAAENGDVECVVFNVAAGFPPGSSFGNFPKPHEVDPSYLTNAFNVGATGCVRVANHAIPPMLERGRGVFLISGATMALRGGADFSCLAPVKAALRSYSQSMYKSYAPQGVHVAHVIIDGVIDSPNTRSWDANMQLMDPAEIADAYLALAQQPSTVWSHEIQLTAPKTSLGMRL